MGPIPELCNGLELIDKRKDFSKFNCKWARKKCGRPAENKSKLPKKRIGKMMNPKTICLAIEKDLLDYIKSQALQKSLSERYFIEPNDLIRDALIKAFPYPKQVDMFGCK